MFKSQLILLDHVDVWICSERETYSYDQYDHKSFEPLLLVVERFSVRGIHKLNDFLITPLQWKFKTVR